MDGDLTNNQSGSVINSNFTLQEFRADCNSRSTNENGQLSVFAEITCSCCTECCDDISGCPYSTGELACQRDLSAETFPDISCGCFDPQSDKEGYPHSVLSHVTLSYHASIITFSSVTSLTKTVLLGREVSFMMKKG